MPNPLARVALLFLFALPLSADPLADVRAALARLTGRDAIRATYELQRAVANEGKFNNDAFTGKVTVEVIGDTDGFHMVFPKSLLEQIAREENADAKSAKAVTPMLTASKEIDVGSTSELLDVAPRFLRMLEGAKLVSDLPNTWQGKPARALVLRLADKPQQGPGKLTVTENRLTLWLGSDMVPLAAEHIAAGKFSFLIFHGEARRKESWHLSRSGDRLVAHRHEFSETSSGMGQKGNESIVGTMRVH
ncbi:MAG: hypothetical protein M3Q69_19285 [Acidobacteriota bacterium]|nr:hypothetical protein [Acidobacteriota bacterium]